MLNVDKRNSDHLRSIYYSMYYVYYTVHRILIFKYISLNNMAIMVIIERNKIAKQTKCDMTKIKFHLTFTPSDHFEIGYVWYIHIHNYKKIIAWFEIIIIIIRFGRTLNNPVEEKILDYCNEYWFWLVVMGSGCCCTSQKLCR